MNYGPYTYTYHVEPKGRYRFSRKELQDLGLSIVILTAAFSILRLRYATDTSPSYMAAIVLISFAAVGTGFFLHEMGHKFLAQKYGAWSEFRSWNTGLMIALLSSFAGFLFAAPGAVHIAGHITQEQNGKISLAGPSINLTIGVLCAIPAILFWDSLPDLAFNALYTIGYVNIFLAGFNMIPIRPLDGSKVFAWNKGIWAAMLVAIGFMFFVVW